MSYHINPDLLRAAQEFSSGNLKVPDDHKKGRGDSKRWNERLLIEDSQVFENDNGMVTVQVRFRVSPASVGSVNINRITNGRYNFNFDAAEGTGHYIMTAMSLSRMMALLRATGHEPEGGFDLNEFFGPTASTPLVGAEVNALIINKPDRDDPDTRRQEILNFSAVED